MKRTPRSTNRNARPAIANPGITRRTFIQRTAAASAVTAFGLVGIVSTSSGAMVEEQTGDTYTYTGQTIAIVRDTWQECIAAFIALGATTYKSPIMSRYDNYTHETVDYIPYDVSTTTGGFASLTYDKDTLKWTMVISANSIVDISKKKVVRKQQ